MPKSQGCKAIQAERAKSDTSYFNVRAKVSMNEPHPDEQASFSSMRVIAPCLTKIAFMSCPPMSRMKETSGAICRAARAIVSIMLPSRPKAAFINSSPYPVEQEPVMFNTVPFLSHCVFNSVNPFRTASIGFPKLGA